MRDREMHGQEQEEGKEKEITGEMKREGVRESKKKHRQRVHTRKYAERKMATDV